MNGYDSKILYQIENNNNNKTGIINQSFENVCFNSKIFISIIIILFQKIQLRKKNKKERIDQKILEKENKIKIRENEILNYKQK